MVGLFTQRAGSHRNIPIVRTGVVASMPVEKIVDQNTGLAFDAYVAEVRSIGGLSGSPVFAFLSTTNRPASATQLSHLDWQIVLVGLIRGHWNVVDKNADGLTLTPEDALTMNTGLALVTPIEEVRAVLIREELVAKRKAAEVEFLKAHAPVLDSENNDVKTN